MVVFAEALSVNGALVTAAKYTVQRPIPGSRSAERSEALGPRPDTHMTLATPKTIPAPVLAGARVGTIVDSAPWARRGESGSMSPVRNHAAPRPTAVPAAAWETRPDSVTCPRYYELCLTDL